MEEEKKSRREKFSIGRLDKALLRILLISIILFMLVKIEYIFIPLKVAFETLIVPVVVSGVLYYITSPIKNYLTTKWKLPVKASIAVIYLILIGIVVLIVTVVGPMIKTQVGQFSSQLPFILADAKDYLYTLEETGKIAFLTDNVSIDTIFSKFGDNLSHVAVSSGSMLLAYLGKLSTLIIHLIVVPFMLFYMLLDGHKLVDNITKVVTKKYREDVKKILLEMSNQLHSYVIGQVTVYASVGLIILIGFSIIGVPYALLLTFIFVIINCVPLVGVFLGAIPAIIVALMDSPMMALSVIIVVTLAHQTDAHLISPLIMGKKLNIHPLTIIVVVLVSGTFLGIPGLIFALPVYVLAKVLVLNLFRIYHLHSSKD